MRATHVEATSGWPWWWAMPRSMAGLSFEALNDLGQRGTRLLIVLNDNEMSISPTVGAMSWYLSRIKLSTHLAWDTTDVRRCGPADPRVGATAYERSVRLRAAVVDFAQPGRLFEDLGITYVGPVDGHDLAALEHTFRDAFRTWNDRSWCTSAPARAAATGRPRRTR